MDRIGRYEIVSELGRGAMGIVYRAHDPRIGRDVAIKTIKLAERAAPDETQGLRDRLFREAQSAGRLSHPGIVTIYDIAEEGGVAYITMEFVEGRTLESLMNAGEVRDFSNVVRLVEQMAAALDYAHAREIVHRDIKPANILVTPEGDIKVTDFGIARIASSTMTQTGTVMGTPSYMSPEQVRGETIDGRSDQFSLSVIAYELVTGRKPFTGDSLTAVIFKIVSEQPTRPREINAELPENLDEIIAKGLAKSAEQRFDTCREFAEGLSECLTGVVVKPPVNATPLKTARQPPPATMIAELQETAAVRPGSGISAEEEETVFVDASSLKQDQEKTSAASARQQTLPPLGTNAFGIEVAADQAIPKQKNRSRVWLEYMLAAVLGVAITVVVLDPSIVNQTMALLGLFQTEDGIAGIAPPDEGIGSSPTTAPTDTSIAPDVTGSTADPASTPAVPQANETVEAPPPAEPATRAATPPVVEPKPKPPAAAKKVQPKPAPTPAVLAMVSFSSQPSGAKVVVDNEPRWACLAPCQLELPAGDHTAVASIVGHFPARRSFRSEGTALDVSFKPDPIVGTVMVSSTPSGADIFVDGVKQARKTNAFLKLTPGSHVVRIQSGDITSEKTVQVEANGTANLQFTVGTP
ncbi:MAG: protein kinase [Acidobacteria bacterium]|nr:protein kinase [Acidobacteriota bacterium]